MKDYVLDLASKQKNITSKINVIREYLQAYALRILYDSGFFRSAAFVGGTALRFLYNLPRYSEDLDFSYENKKMPYLFRKLIKKLNNEFNAAGYNVQTTCKEDKTVQSSFIKFTGLLHEAGISQIPSQKLSIKIEIDTNPPKGARSKIELVNKYFLISFLTYDISSLFAGKIHALLTRKYTKGRDIFDLIWYLSRWRGIEPNIEQLTEALKQTGWERPFPTKENWQTIVYNTIEKVKWEMVQRDIKNFLENPLDNKIITKKHLLILLKQ